MSLVKKNSLVKKFVENVLRLLMLMLKFVGRGNVETRRNSDWRNMLKLDLVEVLSFR